MRRLIGAIKGEALRIESKTTKPKAAALNATKASKQGKSKIEKKDAKCYNCGKKGHYQSECRKPLKTEMNKNESKNDAHEDSYIALHLDTMQMNSDIWLIDSGASNHMTGDKRLFKTYTTLNVPRKVFTASSSTSLTILGEGEVVLEI